MTYKEFKNYFTWLVAQWLTEDENTSKAIRVLASDAGNKVKPLAKEIEELVTRFENPLSGRNSLYAEILNTAFEEVDWQEIAEVCLKEKNPE
jgi:hypothetical protein